MNAYIGQLLDNRYELLEVIGTGGMAVVYKARCHRLNRLVAVKILKDEYSGDEEFRRRFRAEGEAVAMLSHPNIVQVFDVSSADNAYFIVMELIDGISLKQYMEVKGVLNWKETLHFATQIAKGLEHAHSRGIVHRDIKPHNVMVLKNGSVKVMDFGIAQVMNKASTLTKEALGSVHYISPEQAKGSFTDNRSDIYSLGVVMYEMMAGRPPYDGESPVAVAIQHINGGAKLPSVFNPNIPTGLEKIIMRCMALEAKDRYNSASELLQDLEEFRKNPGEVSSHTGSLGEVPGVKPVPPKPRNVAEKVAQSRGGTTSANSSTGNLRRVVNTGAARQPNVPVNKPTASNRNEEALRRAKARRAEEERREAERSRVATIAVFACSAVAVIAIVVFLVAIFNGAILSKERELVDVPYLVGDVYSEEYKGIYSDFVIRLQPQEYSDTFRKGQIMNQNPSGGEKVTKGTELFITVSLGEEPVVKVMEDLAGVTLDRAQSFLTGQGFKTLIREETSDTVEANLVIRTEPEANVELTDGQTIKIWVSKGPEITKKVVPNLIGSDVEDAKKLLTDLGFTKVTVRNVESEKTKGQVVGQSHEKNAEIDVNTPIMLDVSEGPKETEAPTTETTAPETTAPTKPETSTPEPTDAPNSKPTQTVLFDIPVKDAAYKLSIFQNGQAVVTNAQIEPGVDSYAVEMLGSGTINYDIYVDGEFYCQQEVKFGSNG